MAHDDRNRPRLSATVESLRYWVPTIADVARGGESEAPGYWRLSLTPMVQGACPIELTLHASERFDILVADEFYEERPVPSLDLFLPLVEAISEGRVVQRRWYAVATGALAKVETIITRRDGGVLWQDGRTVGAASAVIPADEVERRDRHFLPYRR